MVQLKIALGELREIEHIKNFTLIAKSYYELQKLRLSSNPKSSFTELFGSEDSMLCYDAACN